MGYHAYVPFITNLGTVGYMKLYPRMNATGNAIILYANTVDLWPNITLTGAGNLDLDTANTTRFKHNGTSILYITDATGVVKFVSYDNRDISIEPHGTGNVKFGTHAALSGESLSGYITIKDAGGTARKLGVIS